MRAAVAAGDTEQATTLHSRARTLKAAFPNAAFEHADERVLARVGALVC